MIFYWHYNNNKLGFTVFCLFICLFCFVVVVIFLNRLIFQIFDKNPRNMQLWWVFLANYERKWLLLHSQEGSLLLGFSVFKHWNNITFCAVSCCVDINRETLGNLFDRLTACLNQNAACENAQFLISNCSIFSTAFYMDSGFFRITK